MPVVLRRIDTIRSGLFAGVLWMVSQAAAASDAAIVISITGPDAQRYAPFSTLPVAQELKLHEDTQLIIKHMVTCETLTVQGGHVLVLAEALEVKSGEVVGRDVPEQCASRIPVRRASIVGGLRLRSVPDLSDEPMTAAIGGQTGIVLAGTGRDFITTALVIRDGEVVEQRVVESGVVLAPDTESVLRSGGKFQLVLLDGSSLASGLVKDSRFSRLELDVVSLNGRSPKSAGDWLVFRLDWN